MESVFNFPQPSFLEDQIESIVYKNYGFKCRAKNIYSDRDQNFYIEAPDHKQFILKISNPIEEKSVIKMQNESVKFIREKDSTIILPFPCRSLSGDEILEYKHREKLYYMRLLHFLPGDFLKDRSKNKNNLFMLGAFLARLSNALEGFEHEAGRRKFAWNLSQEGFLYEFGEGLKTNKQKSIVELFLMKKTEYSNEHQKSLRQGIIHNDGNDHNVVVNENGEAVGIIDFGDMVHSYRASEPAIAMAYVCINNNEPFMDMACVLKGFHKYYQLSDDELRFIIYLVCLRLSISVTMAGYRSKLFPDNKYLTISEKGAWKFLKKMSTENMMDWADKFLEYAKSE